MLALVCDYHKHVRECLRDGLTLVDGVDRDCSAAQGAGMSAMQLRLAESERRAAEARLELQQVCSQPNLLSAVSGVTLSLFWCWACQNCVSAKYMFMSCFIIQAPLRTLYRRTMSVSQTSRFTCVHVMANQGDNFLQLTLVQLTRC